MFGGSTLTEYDEIVGEVSTRSNSRQSIDVVHFLIAKTTDENLTSENWELILNLCDKVSDEGQSGYATRAMFIHLAS